MRVKDRSMCTSGADNENVFVLRDLMDFGCFRANGSKISIKAYNKTLAIKHVATIGNK